MFVKYFLNSLKNKPIWYLIVMFCEVVLILAVFCASGILLDSLEKETQEVRNSKYFHVDLRKTLITSKAEDKEKIDSLFDRIEDIEFINMTVATGNDLHAYYGSFPFIRAFDSYEAMEAFYAKYSKLNQSGIPSRQQYDNHEKVVILGNPATDEQWQPIEYRYLDEKHILVGPDDQICTVTGYASNVSGAEFIYGCEPDNMQIYMISIFLNNIPTNQQVEQIDNIIRETFGANIEQYKSPNLQDLLNVRKNFTNIVLTALMLLLIAFNVILIFKQSVEQHKREFAVYRFCGFAKRTSVLYSLTDMLILSVISSAAASVIFEFIVKKPLSRNYGTMVILFTPSYYLLFVLGYTVFSLLLFILCVAPSLKKSAALQYCSL